MRPSARLQASLHRPRWARRPQHARISFGGPVSDWWSDTVSALRVLLTFLSPLAMLCCNHSKPAFSPLIDQLTSGLSVKQTIAVLGPSAKGWQVIRTEETYIPSEGRSVSYQVVELPTYESRGVQGPLVLVYYDDTLTRVDFCPKEFQRFRTILESELQTRLPTGGIYHRVGNTLIWIAKGKAQSDECVAWADDLLMRKYRDSS